jgi:O-methyltransferase
MKLSSPADTIILAERSIELPVFERSPLIKVLKSLLGSAQAILPKSVYEPIYKLSFRIYKGMLRLAYSRHLFYESIFGDPAGRRRAHLVHSVMPYSLVGSSGLEATYDAAAAVIAQEIPGDFVECGVAQGGCSALMAMAAKTDPSQRRMWLFDSFQGIPDPTAEDFDEATEVTGEHIRPLVRGSCLGTKSRVESVLFSKFGLNRDSVCLVEGWFQDTLPLYRDRIGQIALLRIDGDWYESTLCCLHNYYDRVSPGGYIIIDDYGSCFGCKKAVHEFLDNQGIKVRLIPDGRGGVLFSKPA